MTRPEAIRHLRHTFLPKARKARGPDSAKRAPSAYVSERDLLALVVICEGRRS